MQAAFRLAAWAGPRFRTLQLGRYVHARSFSTQDQKNFDENVWAAVLSPRKNPKTGKGFSIEHCWKYNLLFLCLWFFELQFYRKLMCMTSLRRLFASEVRHVLLHWVHGLQSLRSIPHLRPKS